MFLDHTSLTETPKPLKYVLLNKTLIWGWGGGGGGGGGEAFLHCVIILVNLGRMTNFSVTKGKQSVCPVEITSILD